MVLKPDFQQTIETFIFTNLPILMNPLNATRIVVSTTIHPMTPVSPVTPVTPTTSNTPVSSTTSIGDTILDTSIVVTPEVLQAIQAYVVNNFPNIGLPKDIQDVAKVFFAYLPPVVPVLSPIIPTVDTTPIIPTTP